MTSPIQSQSLWQSLQTYNMNWTISLWKNDSDVKWVQILQKVAKYSIILFIMVAAFEVLVKNLIVTTIVKSITAIRNIITNSDSSPQASTSNPSAATPSSPTEQLSQDNTVSSELDTLPSLLSLRSVSPSPDAQLPLEIPEVIRSSSSVTLSSQTRDEGNSDHPSVASQSSQPFLAARGVSQASSTTSGSDQTTHSTEEPKTLNKKKATTASLVASAALAGTAAVVGWPVVVGTSLVMGASAAVLHNTDSLMPAGPARQTPCRNIFVSGRNRMYQGIKSLRDYFYDRSRN